MVSYWCFQSWCFPLAWWFSQQNLMKTGFELSPSPFTLPLFKLSFYSFYIVRHPINFYFEKEFQVFNTIRKRNSFTYLTTVFLEGRYWKGRISQNTSLWHTNYFELKITEKQKWEKLPALPLFAYKQGINFQRCHSSLSGRTKVNSQVYPEVWWTVANSYVPTSVFRILVTLLSHQYLMSSDLKNFANWAEV